MIQDLEYDLDDRKQTILRVIISNYLETGCIERNCGDMCFINRLCMLASSRIKYERLLEKKELTKDDQLELRAILQIQKSVLDDPMQTDTTSC